MPTVPSYLKLTVANFSAPKRVHQPDGVASPSVRDANGDWVRARMLLAEAKRTALQFVDGTISVRKNIMKPAQLNPLGAHCSMLPQVH